MTTWLAFSCWRGIHHPGDWHFFLEANQLLGSDRRGLPPWARPDLAGGLHLYANHPIYQIGPIPLILTSLVRRVGPASGLYAAIAITGVIALGCLWLLERTAMRLRGEAEHGHVQTATLLGGFLVVTAWRELAGYEHLDDGIALLLAIVACWEVVNRRPMICGLALGLAMGCKPWAVGFVPLFLAFPRRDWAKVLVPALAATGIIWLPFIASAPRTLSAGGLGVPVYKNSGLAALGVQPTLTVKYAYSPWWYRLIQLTLALPVAAWLGHRRRWPGILLATLAIRVAFEPQTLSYYYAAVVVAAYAWEVLTPIRVVPLTTLAAFVIYLIALPGMRPDVLGGVVLLVAGAALVAVTLLTRPALVEPRAYSA